MIGAQVLCVLHAGLCGTGTGVGLGYWNGRAPFGGESGKGMVGYEGDSPLIFSAQISNRTALGPGGWHGVGVGLFGK